MSAIVRAIDLGFGNTKFVIGSEAGRAKCALFPSLALLAPGEKGASDLEGKRKTVCVPVGSVWYEVGYDVDEAAGGYKTRVLHDEYSTSDQYMAVTAGALRYIGCPVIDLLVVGLPVADFVSRRRELEKKLTKEPIRVSSTDSVVVRKALVVAQPHGALYDYLQQHGGDTKIADSRNLVVDVGFRTFDWLATNGLKVYSTQSHSVPLGVSAILSAVAKKIAAEHKMPEPALDAIDQLFRTRKPLPVYQRQYDVKSFQGEIAAVSSQAVGEMLTRLGHIYDIKNIVLVGGGASLYRDAVVKIFNKHKILKVVDPLFANLRGFQFLGERHMAGRQEGEPTREAAALGDVDAGASA